jgi:hypothetical protein
MNQANNSVSGAAIAVSVPPIDYTSSAITNTSPTNVAGNSLSGTFTLQNLGTQAGARTVYWSAYVSTNSVFNGSAVLVATGSNPALAAGSSQSNIPFTGSWPTAPNIYYLIINVSAGDDMNPANDSAAGSSIVVAIPVDYTVSTVNSTGATMAGGPLSGNFTLHNNGTLAGAQSVSWLVYASVNTGIDASDSLVASNSQTALAAGASQGIGFNGTWPLIYGNYYLLVSVSASDDFNPANNGGATAGTSAIGMFDEAFADLHDSTSNAFTTGVTLQPGMSVQVSGNLPAAQGDDFIEFNTGTAASVTFSVVWSSGQNIAFNMYTAPSTFGVGTSTVGGTYLVWVWTVDVAGAQRWLDINNTTSANVGAYTLILTAK